MNLKGSYIQPITSFPEPNCARHPKGCLWQWLSRISGLEMTNHHFWRCGEQSLVSIVKQPWGKQSGRKGRKWATTERQTHGHLEVFLARGVVGWRELSLKLWHLIGHLTAADKLFLKKKLHQGLCLL